MPNKYSELLSFKNEPMFKLYDKPFIKNVSSKYDKINSFVFTLNASLDHLIKLVLLHWRPFQRAF